MSGVNRAIILGRCGKDPSIKYTPDGSPVASFSLATSEKWTGKDGQTKEQTEWHSLVAFGKLAEIVGKYVKKGDLLYIEGKIVTQKWKDNSGQDRYTTQIKIEQLQMLGSKSGGNNAEQERPETQEHSDEDIPF